MSLPLGPGSLDQIMASYIISNIPRFTTTPHHRNLLITQQLVGLDDISITRLPPRSFSIEKCSWRQSCQLRSLGTPPPPMLPPGVLLIIDTPICLLYLTNLWLTQCLSLQLQAVLAQIHKSWTTILFQPWVPISITPMVPVTLFPCRKGWVHPLTSKIRWLTLSKLTRVRESIIKLSFHSRFIPTSLHQQRTKTTSGSSSHSPPSQVVHANWTIKLEWWNTTDKIFKIFRNVESCQLPPCQKNFSHPHRWFITNSNPK